MNVEKITGFVGELAYFQLKHKVMVALLDVHTEESEVGQKREKELWGRGIRKDLLEEAVA